MQMEAAVLSMIEKKTVLADVLIKRLSGDQFKVAFVLLLHFHNSKTGDLFPSYTTQAEAAKVCRNTAIRTVKILEEMGVLVVDRTNGGRNKRNTYTLTASPAPPSGNGNGVHGRNRASDEPLTVHPVNSHITMKGNKERNKEGNKEGALQQQSPSHLSKRPAGKKAGRLSVAWQASEGDIAYARNLGMQETMIEREELKFKNYWLSAPGAKGLKRDWNLTWQNWCIRSVEYAAGSQKARGNTSSAMVAALQAVRGGQA